MKGREKGGEFLEQARSKLEKGEFHELSWGKLKINATKCQSERGMPQSPEWEGIPRAGEQ